MRRAREDGAVALTAVVLWFATAATGLLVVGTVADVALAAARAQAAADAAALAAAGAGLLGPAPASPHEAARVAARLHHARLVACCGEVDVLPPLVRVTVVVEPRSVLARLLRGRVTREARASLRPTPGDANASGSRRFLPIR